MATEKAAHLVTQAGVYGAVHGAKTDVTVYKRASGFSILGQQSHARRTPLKSNIQMSHIEKSDAFAFVSGATVSYG